MFLQSRETIGRFGVISVITLLVSCIATSATPSERPTVKTVVMQPKYEVRVDRNVRIPMRDGKTLSADLVRPDVDGRFPMIMEYLPYRKDDVTRSIQDVHWYFAQRGFIGVRLDVRGTGGSDGVNTDEYMLQEQTDGYDAIEWLAKQPYSNGKLGMFGSSYGGFTAIQVAMHRPPHLKAIVPLYATDDRYTDDCHYTRGGNMRMYYDVGTYGGSMVGMNALPPLPEFSGDNWAEAWKSRLENNEPYLLKWITHQVDGKYWRGASLRPDYDKVQVPVFHIAGWRDGYVNAQLRAFTQTKAPRKILIGPWVHARGNTSVPGPRIDYLNEVVRFFAHWLRDEETGIMDEPAVTVYMQDYTTPSRTLDITPGEWRNEADIPAEGTQELVFNLDEDGALTLAGDPKKKPDSENGHDEFTYIPTVGVQSSYWSAGGMTYYLADDQRPDQALSLNYTTPPLQETIRILGWPRVIVHASSSAKVATFVAKLSDVAPDGHSALIVDGSINGTRRDSLAKPTAMQRGEVYELEIPMMPTGWVIKPGHRLRLSIASSDFPNLWPTPEPATNRVYRGSRYRSQVILPVVPEASLSAPQFLPPAEMHSPVKTYSEPPIQQIIHDQITGAVTIRNRRSGTVVLEDNLGQLTRTGDFRCTASSTNPAQASIVGTHTYILKREDGVYEIVAESSIRATKTTFNIVIDLSVTKNGQPFFQKNWMESVPRELL